MGTIVTFSNFEKYGGVKKSNLTVDYTRSVLARRGGSTLPRLRPGEYFLTDENGAYLVDENGNYLTGKDS